VPSSPPFFQLSLVGLLSLTIISCGKSSNVANSAKGVVGQPKSIVTKPTANSPTGSVNSEAGSAKEFKFDPPTSNYQGGQAVSKSETYVRATFSSRNPNETLIVTSLTLPKKNKESSSMVREAENKFAHSAAKHPELTRTWIRNSFSISRTADPSTNQVLALCSTEKRKVILQFDLKSTELTDFLKTADQTINNFFDKNPNGAPKSN
jgi:hypothetical protein